MHLTVRTAWHDNGWNGTVCTNPEGNVYCSGTHSLLSGRIEKNKDTELESQESVAGCPVAQVSLDNNGYIPPCYWSINICSDQEFKVKQGHAFSAIDCEIESMLKPYSFFTWPFRLSFVHNQKKKHGNYWPDLEQRIERYFSRFEEGDSIVFFYANYDNPVSGDDMKYLVTGCSVVQSVDDYTHFDIDEKTLEKLKYAGKKGKKKLKPAMKNFPTINWAVQLTHNPDKAVFLPYQEYINYEDDGESDLLDGIKVTVDNESIRNSFKYVSMDMDDDKCLYLLYQIRKSLQNISSDGIVPDYNAEDKIQRINQMIELSWKKRGSYPALDKILNWYLEDEEESQELAQAVIDKAIDQKVCISSIFAEIFDDNFDLLGDDFEEVLEELDEGDFSELVNELSILSLINLNQNQINKICEDDNLFKGLVINPYVLFEQYHADEDDLDKESITDEKIDFYRIDIALLPDRKFTKKVPLQKKYKESSPYRIRALIRDYLLQRVDYGDTYVSTVDAERNIVKHPLLGKDKSRIRQSVIENPSDELIDCLQQVITVVDTDNLHFYYLNYLLKAERELAKTVSKLIERKSHTGKAVDIEEYINVSLEALKDVIPLEDQDNFRAERVKLYDNIFKRSFSLLTGKPGSGKTFETSQIIEKLNNAGEGVTVLAPTGKAALRLKENIEKNTDLDINAISVETIDRFIFTKGGGDLLQNPEFFSGDLPAIAIDNLVIDESSMVDLWKLYVLFRLIRIDKNYPKRIIMVGDENQLPPIGAGRPFYDMVSHFMQDKKLTKHNYSHLKSNCRQKGDPQILNLADAFSDGQKYFNDALNLLEHEGQRSDGIWVYNWSSIGELTEKIDQSLEQVFKLENLDIEDAENKKFAFLNKLLGLYETGYFPGYDLSKLAINQWQILTPYRPAGYGTLGLNKHIQENYREQKYNKWKESSFVNADKVIRLNNWYTGFKENRYLKLSNGSMGLFSYAGKGESWRFPELEKPLYKVDNSENFDLAYAITVHKSQGSDFDTVFLVIPEKKALLSRELLYTALTRSKERIFLFIQKSENNPIEYARRRSDTAQRNSSLFSVPDNFDKNLIPEGVSYSVLSRIEYIIHNSLTKNGLKISYEKPLVLTKRNKTIHPDFTIHLPNGQIIYWEHLGLLDQRKYYNDWQRKLKGFKEEGLIEFLITTDDMGGIHNDKIQQVIDDILDNSINQTPDNKYSGQHYKLY